MKDLDFRLTVNKEEFKWKTTKINLQVHIADPYFFWIYAKNQYIKQSHDGFLKSHCLVFTKFPYKLPEYRCSSKLKTIKTPTARLASDNKRDNGNEKLV